MSLSRHSIFYKGGSVLAAPAPTGTKYLPYERPSRARNQGNNSRINYPPHLNPYHRLLIKN